MYKIREYVNFAQKVSRHLWRHFPHHKVYTYILNQYHQERRTSNVNLSFHRSVLSLRDILMKLDK